MSRQGVGVNEQPVGGPVRRRRGPTKEGGGLGRRGGGEQFSEEEEAAQRGEEGRGARSSEGTGGGWEGVWSNE